VKRIPLLNRIRQDSSVLRLVVESGGGQICLIQSRALQEGARAACCNGRLPLHTRNLIARSGCNSRIAHRIRGSTPDLHAAALHSTLSGMPCPPCGHLIHGRKRRTHETRGPLPRRQTEGSEHFLASYLFQIIGRSNACQARNKGKSNQTGTKR
jgi:hypothetical protein